MSSFKNNDYIDLMEIVKSLWAYKFLLVALAVIVGMLAVVRVEVFTTDKYVSSGMLYVSNKQEFAEDDELSQQDINTAKSMRATYEVILKTRTFLSQVSLDIDEKFSWGQIKGMTNISAVNNTEIMQISVTANSQQDAYLVAESILRNAQETLGDVFPDGKITVVDNASMPSGPVGKGTAKQGVMGAIVGFMIGCAIVVIRNLFDTKIHKSEDVSNRYSVSILGEIYQ